MSNTSREQNRTAQDDFPTYPHSCKNDCAACQVANRNAGIIRCLLRLSGVEMSRDVFVLPGIILIFYANTKKILPLWYLPHFSSLCSIAGRNWETRKAKSMPTQPLIMSRSETPMQLCKWKSSQDWNELALVSTLVIVWDIRKAFVRLFASIVEFFLIMIAASLRQFYCCNSFQRWRIFIPMTPFQLQIRNRPILRPLSQSTVHLRDGWCSIRSFIGTDMAREPATRNL